MKALNHIALAGLLAVAPATGLTLAERALPQRAAATARSEEHTSEPPVTL